MAPQTEPAFGPGSTRTVAQGESNLESLCTYAKTKGITMITIAYDLDDNDTVDRLRDCATDPDKNFFVATSAAAVAGAFEKHQDSHHSPGLRQQINLL